MEGTKSCPFCAETIQVEAVVCRFCKLDLRTGEPYKESGTGGRTSQPASKELPAEKNGGRRPAS